MSTSDKGWFRLDRAQRGLEAFLVSVEDQIDERAVAKIRGAYENAVRRMTEGFVKALQKADWSVPEVLQQTRIWPDIVESRSGPVAYILVDAMRFEMGYELIDRITRATEVQIRPAIAALPSITPVGMAALLPGASATFSVTTQKGKFGASVDGQFLPDLSARQKFVKSRIPEVVDLALDDLISTNVKALLKKIGNAKIIVIRSTEIDAAGENASTSFARRIMDGVVDELARCLQRLAAAGVGEAVITADHGHLFFATDRDPSMRLDAPGGDTVDLHRRCWIGRGGTTPPGSVRVSGAKLGYATDLDFVFPVSTSVFKSGGDLAYHHGGPSLQELVIPVIAVKLKVDGSVRTERNAVTVTHDFDAVTNRIFTVRIELGGAAKNLFENARKVRPLVLSDERPVARAAIATDAELEDADARHSSHGGLHADGRYRQAYSHSCPRRRDRRRFVHVAEGYSGPAWSIVMSTVPSRDELDNKVNRTFAGKVVRKDLVRKVKVGANVPVFVLEFLLGKYCASSDEMAIQMGLQVVNDTLANNYIRADEAMKAQSKVKEKGSWTFIDKVKVRLVDSDYWAEVNNFGNKFVHIQTQYVRDFERLLTGGIWAQIDMRFETDEESKGKNPFWIEKLTPIQIAAFDLGEYQSLRSEFTTDEWIDLILRSMGYEPAEMTKRLKLLFLTRLVPLCERNFNLVELGPRGTGKSYVIQEVSPYAALMTGPTTVANLFGHMGGKTKGLVQIWDVVGFDEVADLEKMPKEVITTMKTYCESGAFQRGQEAASGEASIALFGYPAGDRDHGPDRPSVRAHAGGHPRRHGLHRQVAFLSPRLGDTEDAE